MRSTQQLRVRAENQVKIRREKANDGVERAQRKMDKALLENKRSGA